MDVKITDYDTLIPASKVENVMKALHSIARGIAKTENNQDNPGSDSLKQLLLSARKPKTIFVNKDTVIAIFAIKPPVGNKTKRYMSGPEICETLFEADWQQKLASENPGDHFALKDDAVRAIIKSANPKISITFNMPLDLTDHSTRSYEDGVKRSEGNRRHQLEMTHWNDPDLYLGAVDSVNTQAEKERGWRTYVAPEKNTHSHSRIR